MLKTISKIILTLSFFTLSFCVIVRAQSISVGPDSATIGQTLNVTISGTDINFGQGSSCLCPDCIDIYYGDIVFRQGSSTIYPNYEYITDSSNVTANFTIPVQANSGKYDVVAGYGTICPIVCNDCFTVNNPSSGTITANPIAATQGDVLTVTISGVDVSFGQGSSCLCPTCIDIDSGGIVFQQGSSTIYPSNINVVNTSTLEASFAIPEYAQTGNYDIITGKGTSCLVLCEDCFTINYPTYCSGTITFTDSTGSFSDGSGNNNYLDNTDCRWLIHPSVGGPITLSFSYIDTESGYDFVKVYDGATTFAPLLGSFSGYNFPAPIVSTGDTLLVQFTSDNSITKKGWDANYTTSDRTITLSNDSAMIGQTLSVTISGVDVNFGQSSSCLCPECVYVNSGNVVFQQGSSTIYPNYVNVINASEVEVNLTIPSQANLGSYDVIAGTGTVCPVFCNDCFTITYCAKVPVINFSSENLACFESSDGSIIASVTGGTPEYTYSWSNGGIDSIIQTLPAGFYSVTVTDLNGCTSYKNITLNQPSPIKLSNVDIVNASCSLCDDGKIFVSVSGGVAPYSFSWSNASTSKDSIINLLPGFYSLTLTDANNCKKVINNFNVSFGTGFSEEKENQLRIYPNPVNDKLMIEINNSKSNNIEITISTIEGRQVQRINRRNESNSQFISEIDFSNMAEQLYIIKIKTENEIHIWKINKLK